MPVTNLIAAPTVSDVLVDIRNFVQSVLGTAIPCVVGIANRVPAPDPNIGYVVLTPIYQERLNYTIDSFSTAATPWPTTASAQMNTRIDVQMDIYGVNAGTWMATLMTLWRDEYACNLMKNSQPLYADDARMMPLVDSEAQYEERWSVTLSAQFNVVVTPAQKFADAVDITLVDIEQKYPT